MMHPKVGGVWVSDIGPFGEVSYSETWLHGCESARWAMNPGTRHHALRPGASVVIYEGTLPLWQGTLTEPERDGTMGAEGLWVRGAGVLALDYADNATAAPYTALDAAIAPRAAVPWLYPNSPFSDAAIGTADPTQTLNGLLDKYSEATLNRWRVNHYGQAEVLAPPVEPRWAVLQADDLWSTSTDDYVTHLNVYYRTGVSSFASYVFTTQEGQDAAAYWGRVEARLDLTGGGDPEKDFGVLTLAQADLYAAAALSKAGPRMSLAEPLVLAQGQLRTIGDSAAGWSEVHAGQGVRMWGMPDRSRTTMALHTDFTIGRLERTETTLTLAPEGLPSRNTRDVIAALSA